MGEFIVQDGRGTRWEQVREQMMLGRSRYSDLQLYSSSASRRHAWVWRSGAQVVIEDVGSQHGTFVNGQLLKTPHLLHHKDVVTMGDARLTYVAQRDLSIRPGTGPPGGPVKRDANRTPPVEFEHMMVSQTFCLRCGATNPGHSTYCLRCGRSLSRAAPDTSASRGEQPPIGSVQGATPTEPVVAQPFPQPGGITSQRFSTDRWIWILAMVMAILAVVLLMMLGVLLATALG